MPYTIFITPTATEDIGAGVEHCNAIATDLVYRFADLVIKSRGLVAYYDFKVGDKEGTDARYERLGSHQGSFLNAKNNIKKGVKMDVAE